MQPSRDVLRKRYSENMQQITGEQPKCDTIPEGLLLETLDKHISEAVAQRCSVKKVLLEISQNSQENTYARVSFLIKLHASACNFIKKETLAQLFSCEFCDISKNTFSYRTPISGQFFHFLPPESLWFNKPQANVLFLYPWKVFGCFQDV